MQVNFHISEVRIAAGKVKERKRVPWKNVIRHIREAKTREIQPSALLSRLRVQHATLTAAPQRTHHSNPKVSNLSIPNPHGHTTDVIQPMHHQDTQMLDQQGEHNNQPEGNNVTQVLTMQWHPGRLPMANAQAPTQLQNTVDTTRITVQQEGQPANRVTQVPSLELPPTSPHQHLQQAPAPAARALRAP